jgi:SHS2 domain-containing protein
VAYRFLPHTADVRVALESDSLAGLLRDGVAVLRILLVGDSPVEEHTEHPIALDTGDPEETLLTLLREALLRYETDGFVPAEIRFDRPRSTRLEGALVGEPFDRRRHEPEPEVKAVTRHGLTVRHDAAGWHAEVVFDV